MFRRTETARERALLRLVDSLQQQLREAHDRIMYMADRPWTPPPAAPDIVRPDYERPEWTPSPEQEPLH